MISERHFLDPARPGYSGRARPRGFGAGGGAKRQVIRHDVTCPACGAPAISESYRSMLGDPKLVTITKCSTFKRKRVKGGGLTTVGCPPHRREEPIEVAAQTEEFRRFLGKTEVGNIRQWCEREKVSIATLSERMGRSRAYLGNALAFRQRLTSEDLGKLAREMGTGDGFQLPLGEVPESDCLPVCTCRKNPCACLLAEEKPSLEVGAPLPKKLVAVKDAFSPPAELFKPLGEMLGTGPSVEHRLDRVESRVDANHQLWNSLTEVVTEQNNKLAQRLDQNERDLCSLGDSHREELRRLTAELGAAQEMIHDLRDGATSEEEMRIHVRTQLGLEAGDTWDQFRAFEASCRLAAQADPHLFRATVCRVWAEVSRG